KFIEQFNALKKELLDLADDIHELENFYRNQRPTWERLRKEYDKFQLNRAELENEVNAAAALKRMRDILNAPAPYAMIKDADWLINTVNAVNSGLLNAGRQRAVTEIDKHLSALQSDLEKAKADAALSQACLKPLDALHENVKTEG